MNTTALTLVGGVNLNKGACAADCMRSQVSELGPEEKEPFDEGLKP